MNIEQELNRLHENLKNINLFLMQNEEGHKNAISQREQVVGAIQILTKMQQEQREPVPTIAEVAQPKVIEPNNIPTDPNATNKS
jgi:hypothetical protein